MISSKTQELGLTRGNTISFRKKKLNNHFSNRNKEQKRIIRESFEKQFSDNSEFDEYIDRQYKKMLQQRDQNPNLIVPRGFLNFVKSKCFKQLLKRTYDYLQSLVEFQQKFQSLTKDQKKDNNLNKNENPLFKMLRYETNILEEKCKEIGFAYMGVLLGYGDNKLVFKDQYFFETMIYFLTHVLRSNFDPTQYELMEEQLNRIFRTNTFNLVKRRNQQDSTIKKYPALKEFKYDCSVFSVMKLEAKLSIQKKFNYSMHIKSGNENNKSLTKPINIPLSTFHSIRSRSPLIASFYPSQKQKLYSFAKEVREKQSFFKGNLQQKKLNQTRQSFQIRKRRSSNLQRLNEPENNRYISAQFNL